MRVSKVGIELIKAFEGIMDGDPSTVNLDPYRDPVGIYTIGWGHAILDPETGDWVRSKNRAKELYPVGITLTEAESLLAHDLVRFEVGVEDVVTVPLNQNQFDALVSFCFNLGLGNFNSSTLKRCINRGDFEGAANEFPKWNRADGKVLKGLIRRRAAEAELFRKGVR